MTIYRDFFQPRVTLPPEVKDPALRRWLLSVADAINGLPAMSTFSYTTPESNVTAQYGTLGVNYASGVSVLWGKQVGSSNTGWTAIA